MFCFVRAMVLRRYSNWKGNALILVVIGNQTATNSLITKTTYLRILYIYIMYLYLSSIFICSHKRKINKNRHDCYENVLQKCNQCRIPFILPDQIIICLLISQIQACSGRRGRGDREKGECQLANQVRCWGIPFLGETQSWLVRPPKTSQEKNNTSSTYSKL